MLCRIDAADAGWHEKRRTKSYLGCKRGRSTVDFEVGGVSAGERCWNNNIHLRQNGGKSFSAFKTAVIPLAKTVFCMEASCTNIILLTHWAVKHVLLTITSQTLIL